VNGSTTVNLPVAEAAEILRAEEKLDLQVGAQGGILFNLVGTLILLGTAIALCAPIAAALRAGAWHLPSRHARTDIPTVDLIGGAPEMIPDFRYFIARLTALRRHVIDRCNLTILLEPGCEDLADFLPRHRVEILASVPCDSPQNVDAQRGDGVFDAIILKTGMELNRRAQRKQRLKLLERISSVSVVLPPGETCEACDLLILCYLCLLLFTHFPV
jgi:hypothetical protein